MYRAYRNQAAAAYLSFYFFIFLSLQLSNIKMFHHTLLTNCEAWKIETLYPHGQRVDKSCIPKVFITFFSRTARHKKLKQNKVTNMTSRKLLGINVTPDLHLTYSKNGGNLGLVLKMKIIACISILLTKHVKYTYFYLFNRVL